MDKTTTHILLLRLVELLDSWATQTITDDEAVEQFYDLAVKFDDDGHLRQHRQDNLQ